MADFQTKKIPIIQGINDIPKAPDSLGGGNISHFYEQYNQLVDELEESITDNENLSGDAFSLANSANNNVYDYYYYLSLPNKSYIIFQNINTEFKLGTHTLSPGVNAIGAIPANGELFRIIAEGSITNFVDIQWQIGGNLIYVPKVAYYPTGGMWWFYDVSDEYADPYGYTPPGVSENDVINLITNDSETDITFRLEMAVFATPAGQLQQ